MVSTRHQQAGEVAELKAIAQRLVQRLEKMEAELTADQEPANDADLKPTLDDFAAIRARRKRRGHRG